MNEVVIFCESYPQIKNALYVATHDSDNRPITLVITGSHDLLEFFKVINERTFHNAINIVFFEVYQGPMAKAVNKVTKALYLLPDIVGERRCLRGIFDGHFAQLTGADVYFFSGCSNLSIFYLLRKISKTNRLVYMPDPVYDALSIHRSAPQNPIELMYLARCKLVYGYGIVMGRHPIGQAVPCMPDRFFRENVARVISREERDSMLKDFSLSRFKVFDVGDYSVMYFHEDLVEHDYITNSEAFGRELNEVFNILRKHFPENKVARKYHPSSTEGRSMIRFGDVLPDFIPAEFLYNEKVKLYLGFTSMALANVEKGLAVSLINLISLRSDTIREQLKKMLIQWSRSEILFPKSLDEFEEIVAKIKGSA